MDALGEDKESSLCPNATRLFMGAARPRFWGEEYDFPSIIFDYVKWLNVFLYGIGVALEVITKVELLYVVSSVSREMNTIFPV